MVKDSYTILSTKSLEIGYNKVSITTPMNLNIERGTLTALIGTNGTGKSTLLRTLSGLQAPTKGYVSVFENKLSSLSSNKKARFLSHVLTDNECIKTIKVSDLVAMGRFPYTNLFGKLTENDYNIIELAMKQVDIFHKKDKKLYELSDGERQRTFIAKALAQDTPLIFLDEPTSYLDMKNKIEIIKLLHSLAHTNNKTILISTHDIDIILQTADKIWLMKNKTIIPGVPEDLILNGEIERTFHSNAFSFNKECGCFKVKQNVSTPIIVSGDECLEMQYTLQALRRCGYNPIFDESAQNKRFISVKITAPKNQKEGIAEWEIEYERRMEQRFNIENVLHTINEIISKIS